VRISARRLEIIIGLLISAVGLLVYIVTLCPTTDFIDAGELSTVVITLGIAHPTGYPLFTLVGWLFAHLPIPLRSIEQMNLMAALFCSAALFVYFRLFLFFLGTLSVRNPIPLSDPDGRVSSRALTRVFMPAAAGTLLLGFSETYWSQALSIEVYSSHLFLVAVVLFLFTNAVSAHLGRSDSRVTGRREAVYWHLFAFALGLSFTNHMTTILLAPGFLYLYFSACRFTPASRRRLISLVPAFLAGFSLYMYLPLRAAQQPIMNWGNPVDLERFLWHFTGKQYRVWIFSSTESAARQLKYFFDSVLPEFAYFPIVLAVIGLWNLFAEKKQIAIFTVLLFLGCLLYSINYDIHDIDSYFLLAYITIAIWAALGAASVIGAVKNSKTAKRVAGVLLASCLIPIAVNYSKVDESRLTIVENYTKDMFKSLDPNAIVLTYQWDYFVSAAYYFQIIEGVRPDVVVVDKELLRRSWYFLQLQKRYPWLIEGSRKEIDAYLAELRKFEHDLPYDHAAIEFRYNNLIHSFIQKNYSSRPVYATPELEAQYTSGYSRVPSGLAFRLFADTLYHEIAHRGYAFAIPTKTNKYVDGIVSLYGRSFFNHALYLSMFGKNADALSYLDSAQRVEPGMREAQFLRERILGNGKF
jgi:hypothetical protein